MTWKRSIRLDKDTLEALKLLFGLEVYGRLMKGQNVEGIIELKIIDNHLEISFTEDGHLCECCGEAWASICWDCHYNRMDEEKQQYEQRINELESEISDLEYRLRDKEDELDRFRRLFEPY